MPEQWDCLIVGAGPGGLSAALYMARFLRRVLVLHDGTSRTLRISKTHNVPGFPDGVAGPDLIERMTEHATRFGAVVREAEVVSASRVGNMFEVQTREGERMSAPALILATGLFMNQISLPHDVHEAAMCAGVVRYCPICDGYEHGNDRIAVVGCDEQGAKEALFLRRYSSDITLIPRAFDELDSQERRELEQAGITTVEHALDHFELNDDTMLVYLQGQGKPLVFDVVYPALGTRQRTQLAQSLGIVLNDQGAVDARSPYGTTVAGLYCIGDIVDGLDQISVAMGHGAIAATKAHNYLRTMESEGGRT
jgi:thioredoxin reductase (NADPH)